MVLLHIHVFFFLHYLQSHRFTFKIEITISMYTDFVAQVQYITRGIQLWLNFIIILGMHEIFANLHIQLVQNNFHIILGIVWIFFLIFVKS